MDVDIVLLVTSVNLGSKGDVRFLLIESNGDLFLPTHPHTGKKETSKEVAADLLYLCTGLKALINGDGWVQLKLGGVFDDLEKQKLTIGFTCLIPESTQLVYPHAAWFSFGQLMERKPACLEMLSQLAMKL